MIRLRFLNSMILLFWKWKFSIILSVCPILRALPLSKILVFFQIQTHTSLSVHLQSDPIRIRQWYFNLFCYCYIWFYSNLSDNYQSLNILMVYIRVFGHSGSVYYQQVRFISCVIHCICVFQTFEAFHFVSIIKYSNVLQRFKWNVSWNQWHCQLSNEFKFMVWYKCGVSISTLESNRDMHYYTLAN